MNVEASATIQSWPLFEGTFTNGAGTWLTTDSSKLQPGTVGFQGGPVCTRYEGGRTFILPGCRGPGDPATTSTSTAPPSGPTQSATVYQRVHPFTGQQWASEMAIVSWNMLMAFAALSFPEDPNHPKDNEFAPNDPFRTNGCSFAAPQYCSNVAAYNSIIGARRSSIRAGGNGQYGRRDFIWHGGGDLALRYEKRNVLGVSMDFAEDFTKSNWGFEFTWIEGLPFSDNNSWEATSQADTYNLTLSVDRPTFVNFLNQNRTFFFNTQWFFQYVDGYERGFTSNGPFNMLATFTVTTGYFQDRLLPGFTIVYDFAIALGSRAGERDLPLHGELLGDGRHGRILRALPDQDALALDRLHSSNRVGRGAYQSFVENGLSPIRERDELYFTLRYTF